jgi:hypothetical protein
LIPEEDFVWFINRTIATRPKEAQKIGFISWKHPLDICHATQDPDIFIEPAEETNEGKGLGRKGRSQELSTI